MLSSKVLLLNQNFVPITVTTARRAVIMVWTGKAEIIESSDNYFHSVNDRFVVPSIIRLLVFVKISFGMKLKLTKKNIFKRDRGICQYCGTTIGPMTIDHVVPRSHGGGDTWENLVCACARCNNIKDDCTPHEAGMKLLKKPRKPSLSSFLYSHKISIDSAWLMYIKSG